MNSSLYQDLHISEQGIVLSFEFTNVKLLSDKCLDFAFLVYSVKCKA